MFRWLTAGESHGRALVAICEGVPAGVQVSTEDVAAALARRRAGYGRGARMTFERDEVELTAGVRHGRTLGGPVAIGATASGIGLRDALFIPAALSVLVASAAGVLAWSGRPASRPVHPVV